MYRTRILGALAVGFASVALGACGTAAPHSSSRPTRCATNQLSIQLGPVEAGLGHWAMAVIFRNTSATTCTLSGYPSVIEVDHAGNDIGSPRPTPNGYLGGLSNPKVTPTVTLHPRGTAAALVEGINAANISHPCSRSAASAMLVTPPGDTRSTRLAHPCGNPCNDVEIHPVIAGNSGSERPKATS